jgi:hypothetical protein
MPRDQPPSIDWMPLSESTFFWSRVEMLLDVADRSTELAGGAERAALFAGEPHRLLPEVADLRFRGPLADRAAQPSGREDRDHLADSGRPCRDHLFMIVLLVVVPCSRHASVGSKAALAPDGDRAPAPDDGV